MEFQNIQSTFNAFIQNHNELDKIRKDISAYQKQFKNRVDQLKKENGENEKILLKYLEDNKLPGIRSGDFLLLTDEKPLPYNKQFKEQKIQTIFQSHQIDSNSKIYKDVLEVIQSNRNVEKLTKTLKFKRYNDSKDD